MGNIPDWALKHKQKGTELRKVKNRFYLYKISSVWDPAKKRARKITEKFLGKITEQEGLVKPKHERIAEGITVKEFGASQFVKKFSPEIIQHLKENFPSDWETIFAFAAERLLHASPIKNVSAYWKGSHLSDEFPNAEVSANRLGNFLDGLGKNRKGAVGFMKNFVSGSRFSVIDLTHVFSLSEDVISATLGHNSNEEYVPQINFTLLFSLDKKQPSFFRLVPGSISDVSTIPLTLAEAGVEKAVVIGDKGFYSGSNVDFLESHGLEYILPVKRNDKRINYRPIKNPDRRTLNDNDGGFFIFDMRAIWFYEKKTEDGKRLLVFLDGKLKAEEEKDFLLHVDGGKLSMEEFYGRQFAFGTICVITNTDFSPKQVFELLKGRVEIEAVFDTFKNLLHADRTYMRSDDKLQGWMFANFVSLLLYYKIYRMLSEHDLLKKYSPKDVLLHLSRVYKLKVGEKWVVSEIPKTSRELAEQLEVSLHIT